MNKSNLKYLNYFMKESSSVISLDWRIISKMVTNYELQGVSLREIFDDIKGYNFYWKIEGLLLWNI